MAGIQALVSAYGEESDSEGNESPAEEITEDHTAHLKPGSSIDSLKSKFLLNCAPVVINKVTKCHKFDARCVVRGKTLLIRCFAWYNFKI
jgi:hypothetical protein